MMYPVKAKRTAPTPTPQIITAAAIPAFGKPRTVLGDGPPFTKNNKLDIFQENDKWICKNQVKTNLFLMW
jgi:hypothetical protein